jgi:AbrB family looped-hinge helix DNA binding protein
MDSTIAVTIDAAGRIVIPKRIREAAGLVPGEALSVRVRDGRVEIEPAPQKVKIVKRGAVRVAEGTGGPLTPLTRGVVESTRADMRRRHG